MITLRIVRRYTLVALEHKRDELLSLISDGVEELVPELDLINTLLRLGEEEGELDYYEEEELAYDPKLHNKLFTPNTIKLLEEVHKGVNSISELARRLNRDVSNVWKDLMYLSKLGLVLLVRVSGKVKPIPLAIEYGISFE